MESFSNPTNPEKPVQGPLSQGEDKREGFEEFGFEEFGFEEALLKVYISSSLLPAPTSKTDWAKNRLLC